MKMMNGPRDPHRVRNEEPAARLHRSCSRMDGRRTGVRRPRTARELGAISEDGARSGRVMKTEGKRRRTHELM